MSEDAASGDRTGVTAVDDPDRQRFVAREGDHEAQLVYRVEGDRLVLAHTEVPESMGGRGVGGVLVRAAVEHAAAEGRTVVPSCPYARHWLETHPDAAATVTVDWS